MIHRVAVIGLGNIAKRHRENLKLRFPDAIVLAMSASGRVVDETIKDADQIIDNLSALIECKPNFVIVASPAPFHAEHAIPLIQAGIPVLIEKPIAANVLDSDRLQEASRLHQVPVGVGYCLRYLSSAQKIKDILNDGLIGNVYNVFAQVGQYLPDWRVGKDYGQSVSANQKLGGGALLELSHELDYLYWLFGPLSLQYSQLRNSNELDLDVEELADVVLTTNSGIVCNLHLDFLQKQTQRNCSIIGSKGRLDWDLIQNTITLHTDAGDSALYSSNLRDNNLMYLAMIDDFVALMNNANSDQQCITFKEAAQTVVLIEQIKRHATWGIKQ